MLRFCGLDEDPQRVDKAVRFSRFEEAQKQESEHGFGERMPASERFFRKGQVGAWREELAPELVQKLITDHAAVMQRFGYLSGNGELI